MARGRIYNRVYTPELWSAVNPDNKAILEDFLAEYRQQKKSKSTLDAYYQDGRIILIYILQHHQNKSILEMTKKDFRNFSLWCTEDCQMSASRTNRLKATCNSMLTFCEEDDDYDYDTCISKKVKGVPRERVKNNENDFFFTFDEFIAVRDKLVEMGDLQTAVLWSLSFDSAGRRNEIYQVEKKGLLDGNKTNVVRGKRGKMFPLVYLDDTRDLIKQYLEKRGDDDIDSLWVSMNGKDKKTVDKDALYNRILKCSKILSEIRGEEVNIFPHSIRHSRLECLMQGTDKRLVNSDGTLKKFDIEACKVVAHHTDISTTSGYMKNHDEDLIDDMFGF